MANLGQGPVTTKSSALQAASRSPSSVARELAERIPFVHHPASARFPEWRTWGSLKSKAVRSGVAGVTTAEQLRDHHVFTYAGPSCYSKPSAVGDAAAYFDPSLEAGASGSATPFDSGALVEPNPCIHPWAGLAEGERWTRFQGVEVALDRWRESFGDWLERCYDEPVRYLDSDGDPYSDGEPDRPEPPELTEHNGAAGRAKYTRCADRRAWTWEVRFRDEIGFQHVCVLHVPHEHLSAAQDLADQIERASNRFVEVKTLPRGAPGSAREIYRDSGRVLREVVGL